MTKIEEIWQSLEEDIKQKNNSGVIRKLFSSDTPLYISLGICSDTMKHLIAFEIDEANITNYKSLPSIKGIEVNKVHFGDERNESISLVLSVSNNIYNRSFDILCEDLIGYVNNSSEIELISKLADRLGLWKKFFSEIPREILTEEKQIGLAGELNLLHNFLKNNISKVAVVEAWKGYDNSSKDFVFSDSSCVEVKTSKSPKTVKISSEDQLDETDHSNCYMYFCHFTFSKNSDISLNILVDQIREELADSANVASKFDAGLLQYGYCDIHRDYYNRCFSFKKELTLCIEADFPRIRKTDIREGVNNVRYAVDLTKIDSYERPFSVLIEIIKSEENDG